MRRGEVWRPRDSGPFYAWRYDAKKAAWVRRSTGLSIRVEAARIAQAWHAEGERVLSGFSRPSDRYATLSLDQHIKDFVRGQRNHPGEITGPHIKKTEQILRRVIVLTGWSRITEVSERELLEAIAEMDRKTTREGGLANASKNAVRTAWKTFSNWAWREKRLEADPLATIPRWRVRGHRKRLRRSLSWQEFLTLLDATERSGVTVCTLEPADRAMLYRIAAATGYRWGGLMSLTPSHFVLDGAEPFVALDARSDKARRGKPQPLPVKLISRLRTWLPGRPPHERLWRVKQQVGSQMIERDLAMAGIARADDKGRIVDFHALRYTFATRLATFRPERTVLRDAMQHSTVELSEGIYIDTGDRQVRDLVDTAIDFDQSPTDQPDTANETCEVTSASPEEGDTGGESATSERCTGAAKSVRAQDDSRGLVTTQTPSEAPREGRAVVVNGPGESGLGITQDDSGGLMTSKVGDLGFEPRLSGSESIASDLQSLAAQGAATGNEDRAAQALLIPCADASAALLDPNRDDDRRPDGTLMHARDRAEAGKRPNRRRAMARIQALASQAEAAWGDA